MKVWRRYTVKCPSYFRSEEEGTTIEPLLYSQNGGNFWTPEKQTAETDREEISDDKSVRRTYLLFHFYKHLQQY